MKEGTPDFYAKPGVMFVLSTTGITLALSRVLKNSCVNVNHSARPGNLVGKAA